MEEFRRPEATILNESALVPERNLIVPAPNQFTHELSQAQPYYYTAAQQGAPPDGVFQAGTKVVLLVYDGGSQCRVVDSHGLYVETAYEGLKKL
jgi:hypothetical protein